jgi:hypothetical protein
MGSKRTMRWPLIFVILGTLGLHAQEAASKEKYFWSPELPNGQAFLIMPRSIKSYRLALYDIRYEGENYPVTELNVELTHGVARFIAVESSSGKPVPPSLRDIADGRYDANGRFGRMEQGQSPPVELTARGEDADRYPRFLLESPSQVTQLHEQLEKIFHFAFPW